MSEIQPLRPDPLGEGFLDGGRHDADDDTRSRIRQAIVGATDPEAPPADPSHGSPRRASGRPARTDDDAVPRPQSRRPPAARSPWTGRRQGRVTVSGVGMNVVVLIGIVAAAPILFAVVSYVSSRSGNGDQAPAVDRLVVDRVKARTRSTAVPALPRGATTVRVELYGSGRARDVTIHRDDTNATMDDVALPYAALVPIGTGAGSVGLHASSTKATADKPLQCRIYVNDALVALNTAVHEVECDVTSASLPTK